MKKVVFILFICLAIISCGKKNQPSFEDELVTCAMCGGSGFVYGQVCSNCKSFGKIHRSYHPSFTGSSSNTDIYDRTTPGYYNSGGFAGTLEVDDQNRKVRYKGNSIGRNFYNATYPESETFAYFFYDGSNSIVYFN